MTDSLLSWRHSGLEIELRDLVGAADEPLDSSDDWPCTYEPRLHEIADFLRAKGAPDLPHANGTYLTHLAGTWRILAFWKQPPWLCRFGLMHGVYSTDAYQLTLLDVEERENVRQLVGRRAETMAYLFSTLDRRILHRDLRLHPQIPATGVRVRNRITNEELLLSRRILSWLLLCEMANLAEQARKPYGPAVWLHRCTAWASQLTDHVSKPTLFRENRGQISKSDEHEARSAYLRAKASEHTRGLRELERACRLNPWIGEPWLLRSRLATDPESQQYAARRALRLFLQWGTAWDKSLRWEDLLQEARERSSEERVDL